MNVLIINEKTVACKLKSNYQFKRKLDTKTKATDIERKSLSRNSCAMKATMSEKHFANKFDTFIHLHKTMNVCPIDLKLA